MPRGKPRYYAYHRHNSRVTEQFRSKIVLRYRKRPFSSPLREAVCCTMEMMNKSIRNIGFGGAINVRTVRSTWLLSDIIGI